MGAAMTLQRISRLRLAKSLAAVLGSAAMAALAVPAVAACDPGPGYVYCMEHALRPSANREEHAVGAEEIAPPTTYESNEYLVPQYSTPEYTEPQVIPREMHGTDYQSQVYDAPIFETAVPATPGGGSPSAAAPSAGAASQAVATSPPPSAATPSAASPSAAAAAPTYQDRVFNSPSAPSPSPSNATADVLPRDSPSASGR